MTIKKIITGGCSFSSKFGDETWPHIIQENYKDINFSHTGFPAQGQEMIQKKVSLALINELDNYKPEEICVIVMWSGTHRKSFYVDNHDFIDQLTKKWVQNNKFGIPMQLLDLHDQIKPDENLGILDSGVKWQIKYNKVGGWYTFNPSYNSDDSLLGSEYEKSHSTDLAATIVSFENIIMLQNLCKLKNVKFYQSFYMNNTYNDILKHRNNLNIDYLYRQFDTNTIISIQGIFDFLQTANNYKQYFQEDNNHPNRLGHEKWTSEILLPFLKDKL